LFFWLFYICKYECYRSAKGKGKTRAIEEPFTLDDNTVYLEDLESGAPPPRPSTNSNSSPNKSTPSTSPSKAKWQDHDPYQLPDVDLAASIANATRSSAPDPRLATEDELRGVVDEMLQHTEELDISSDAFRALPVEVQYEVLGDLRLRSRQTSHRRLQAMLRAAPTPLDFSREQIKGVKARNTLTMQVLATTDSISQARVTIPVRVAGERNRQYVLARSEVPGGGWVLGRGSAGNEGTRAQPIKIDVASDEENSDADMEEVKM
jgi:DNA excision repair protein ERCC-5